MPHAETKHNAWREAEARALGTLNLRAEYAAMGVRLCEGEPNRNGWLSCHAVGREDATPSAAIHVASGRYRDLGGDWLSLSLWEFAARFGGGRWPTWKEARAYFLEKAGIDLPKGRPSVDPAEQLDFRDWTEGTETLCRLWCLKKPGVTVEAVKAAGGRWAVYRGQFSVVALPIFGPAMADADPVGWTLYNSTGGTLPVYHKGRHEPEQKKIKQTYGSKPGLVGLHALLHTAAADSTDPASQTIWSVEGPSDLLALWSAIPPDLRQSHLVLTNGNGAAEKPTPGMLTPFMGRRVVVIRDADRAGEESGNTWAEWLAPTAAEVRRLRLPYEVTESHGKDLRDWLTAGHGFEELVKLASESEPLRPATQSENNKPLEVLEADDDPHRLARLFLQHAVDSSHGLILRYHRQEWYRWEGVGYTKLDGDLVRGKITETAKEEFNRLNIEAQLALSQDGEEVPKAKKVTRRLVSDVYGAAGSLAGLDLGIDDEAAEAAGGNQ